MLFQPSVSSGERVSIHEDFARDPQSSVFRGMMAGGLYNTVLRGTGYVAVVTDGNPIAFDVAAAPTFADAQAVVLWTGGRYAVHVATPPVFERGEARASSPGSSWFPGGGPETGRYSRIARPAGGSPAGPVMEKGVT